jgi:hypothetical protein
MSTQDTETYNYYELYLDCTQASSGLNGLSPLVWPNFKFDTYFENVAKMKILEVSVPKTSPIYSYTTYPNNPLLTTTCFFFNPNPTQTLPIWNGNYDSLTLISKFVETMLNQFYNNVSAFTWNVFVNSDGRFYITVSGAPVNPLFNTIVLTISTSTTDNPLRNLLGLQPGANTFRLVTDTGAGGLKTYEPFPYIPINNHQRLYLNSKRLGPLVSSYRPNGPFFTGMQNNDMITSINMGDNTFSSKSANLNVQNYAQDLSTFREYYFRETIPKLQEFDLYFTTVYNTVVDFNPFSIIDQLTTPAYLNYKGGNYSFSVKIGLYGQLFGGANQTPLYKSLTVKEQPSRRKTNRVVKRIE